MSTHPLVSIIINNYNYIREAIDSALQQSYDLTEVIVVDDGSTDDSPSIISSYGSEIKSILKPNGGQGSAFNEGFAMSRGEIIVFLDADDCLLPHAVEIIMHAFEEKEIVKAQWPLYVIDERSVNSFQLTPSVELQDGNFIDKVIAVGPDAYLSPPTSGNAWNRDFLEKVLPMPAEDYRISADLYLCMLAPVYGEIKSIRQPLALYRMHGGNNYRGKSLTETMLQEKVKRFETSCRILKSHMDKKHIEANPEDWRNHSWLIRLQSSFDEIKKHVPENEKLILADGDQWQVSGEIAGRQIVPIMEKDNQYWGQPANDEDAIREIEQQISRMAGYIFFAWPVFWWLDYYKGLVAYLENNHTPLTRNERLVGFKLNAH